MSTYVLLMNFTEQGIRNIKNAPARIESAVKAIEAAGCKQIAYYAVMGQYDCVAIVEAPGDEVALGLLLKLGSLGNVRTTTLKAFSAEEYKAIVKKLP